jgi:hypothetical protein
METLRFAQGDGGGWRPFALLRVTALEGRSRRPHRVRQPHGIARAGGGSAEDPKAASGSRVQDAAGGRQRVAASGGGVVSPMYRTSTQAFQSGEAVLE